MLDTADGPLRVEVKLAPECGGDFQTTAGVTLVNAPLKPQPTVGRAYAGSASRLGPAGRLRHPDRLHVPRGHRLGRVYANDESVTYRVTPACTAAGRAL